jgi:hypothetical protein
VGLIAVGAAPPAPVGYDLLVVLHILVALAGVVGHGLSAGYAQLLGDGDPSARQSARRFFSAGRNGLSYCLYLVPVTGAALLLAHSGSFGGRWWLPASLGLWTLAAVVAASVVQPAEALIAAATRSAATALDGPARRLARGALAVDLLVVAAVPLMILKP